jgi:hypothetical protein
VRREALEEDSVKDANKFRSAMHEIAARKGDFTLFALLLAANTPYLHDDAPGTWDLVASAPWIADNDLKTTRELVDLLRKTIDTKTLVKLARVEPLPIDNAKVQFLLRNAPVEDGERHIASTDLLGMQIDKGIIFRAWDSDKKKPARKQEHPALAGASRVRR